jgi:hypothetical protein
LCYTQVQCRRHDVLSSYIAAGFTA